MRSSSRNNATGAFTPPPPPPPRMHPSNSVKRGSSIGAQCHSHERQVRQFPRSTILAIACCKVAGLSAINHDFPDLGIVGIGVTPGKVWPVLADRCTNLCTANSAAEGATLTAAGSTTTSSTIFVA